MSSPRFMLLVALLGATAFPARAQTPCEGGVAAGFPCENVDLLGRLSLSQLGSPRNNDVWGWTDPETGHEYALVGMENGLAFVDVTEPTAPAHVGTMPTQTFSSVWRDVKVYADHAFVVADGASSHGMQVFDLTRLRGLTAPPQTLTPDHVYTGTAGHTIGSAHNIVMNEATGLAAIVGSGDCGGGLHLVDVTDPLSPAFQGCFAADGYTHDAQCVTYHGPDPDYAGRDICVGSQGTFGPSSHIVVADVTDPTNPQLVSRGFYADAVYTHQGWFTDDHRYFLVGDEIDDGASATTRTVVFDMTDLDAPEFDFFYFGPLETTDHNLYIRGDYAFLSNYEGGLRIVDISGIDDGVLVEVGSFDTFAAGDSESYSGQWSNYPFFESGTLIANDRDYGLFALQSDLSFPTASETPASPARPAALSEPVPNPTGDRSTLTLTVAEPMDVVAEVLDVRGRRVALLYDGPARPDTPLTLAVDGATLPGGIYLVRVSGPRFTATRRISIVR